MNSIDPVFGPLRFVCESSDDCVLAIITETTGPGFREAGAMMAIAANDAVSGSLSSGCIEADIVHQAHLALASGAPITVKYGAGSPFMDLRLPCGGAIEVLLLPRPDRAVLRDALAGIECRIPQAIAVHKSNGAMALLASAEAQNEPFLRPRDRKSVV